jgi:hypothetical protein
MKKLLFLFLIVPFILSGCHKKNKTYEKQAFADTSFSQLSRDFISGYIDWRPEYGVYLGLHKYDGRLSDLSKPSLDKELARLKKLNQELQNIDTASLSTNMFYDLRILRCAVNQEIFNFEDLDSYHNNPMTYAGGLDVNIYIKRNFAPLENRLRSIIAVEKKSQDWFATARANLADSLARPYVETAIKIAQGSASFLQGDLIVALKEVKNDSLMAEFNNSNKNAIAELNNFIT